MWAGLLWGLLVLVPPAAAEPPCPSSAQLSALVAAPSRSLGDHRALVDALRQLHGCAQPAHGVVLGQVFVRSRHGALAEDPDLFESALVSLRRLPPEAVEEALSAGVLPELLHHTWDDLWVRWLEPALEGPAPDQAARLSRWEPQRSQPLLAAADRVGARLIEGYRADPKAFLTGLSAHGGSISHEAAAELRDALLAELVRMDPAELAPTAAVVGEQSGHGGPQLAVALRQVAETLPAAQAAHLIATAERLPAARPLGAIGPPAVAPGQTPGLEWQAPRTPDSDATTRGQAPLRLPRGLPALLLGLGLFTVAWWGRRLPRVAAVVGGLGALLVADGLAAWGWPGHAALPELGLIPTPSLRPSIEGPTCWYGAPGTRIEGIPCAKDPTRPLVAVVGASSVHGSHYLAEQAFPAQLQDRLRDHSARVLNLGIGGATSATLAGWAGPEGPLRPPGGGPVDVLVVYYGHNEAAQLASLQALGGVSAGRLRTRLWARNSGLYSLMSALRPDSFSKASPVLASRPEPAAVLALAAAMVRHNLGVLLSAARELGAAPVVVLPATNLRFAHVSLPEGSPDLLFAEAQALAEAGRGAQAAALLQRRIDAGVSPREMVSPVRQALEAVAADHGAPLVDAQAAFLARAPDGVSPSGLFWDDLHPSAEGHRVLADLLAPVIATELAARRAP